MGAKSTSHLNTQRFSGDLDSWHLGGYAVRQDGPIGLRLGAIYSDHAGQNKRDVNLLDYKEQLKANTTPKAKPCFPNWAINWAARTSASNPSPASVSSATTATVSRKRVA